MFGFAHALIVYKYKSMFLLKIRINENGNCE